MPDLFESAWVVIQIASTPHAAGPGTNPDIRVSHQGRKELAQPPSRVSLSGFWSFRYKTPRTHGSHGYAHVRRVRDYPTEPSISSSINRLSSTLYSIGNWRTRSLTKPLTLKLIAWASLRPRCCI